MYVQLYIINICVCININIYIYICIYIHLYLYNIYIYIYVCTIIYRGIAWLNPKIWCWGPGRCRTPVAKNLVSDVDLLVGIFQKDEGKIVLSRVEMSDMYVIYTHMRISYNWVWIQYIYMYIYIYVCIVAYVCIYIYIHDKEFLMGNGGFNGLL